MDTQITLQQKIKVLNKLYGANYRTEKELQQLGMEQILKIPGITLRDMGIIMELQKRIKSHQLYSYLGENVSGEPNYDEKEEAYSGVIRSDM